MLNQSLRTEINSVVGCAMRWYHLCQSEKRYGSGRWIVRLDVWKTKNQLSWTSWTMHLGGLISIWTTTPKLCWCFVTCCPCIPIIAILNLRNFKLAVGKWIIFGKCTSLKMHTVFERIFQKMHAVVHKQIWGYAVPVIQLSITMRRACVAAVLKSIRLL